MKKNEDQFPEGFDWSWTSEAQDERAERMAKEQSDKAGDVNLIDKKTWKKPPF